MAVLVFLSSVIEGFEAFRDAASKGVADAGCRTLRIEDLPSQDRSPRNACLDLVDEADVYLLVIGDRGGWTSPSGMKVTEEEYEHAQRRGKKTVVFLTNQPRDTDAERLARAASGYVDGRFRKTISTPEELQKEVARALRDIAPRFTNPMTDPEQIQRAVLALRETDQQTTLRLAVAPERASDDLVDVLQLEDVQFLEAIYRLGHEPDLRLFRYELPKSSELRRRSLVVTQESPRAGEDPISRVRLELDLSGLLLVDLNVTGVRPRRPTMPDGHQLLEGDVESRARLACSTAITIFDLIDPHQRADRLVLNFALGGIGYRQWTRTSGERSSFGMRMSASDPVPAFEQPRVVSRSELRAASDLVIRAVTMLRRAVGEG